MRRSGGFALALAAMACGGAASAPPPEPKPAPTASAPSPADELDADLSAEDRAVMEERRVNFVAACNENGNHGDYCACTWNQMRLVMSREEILADRAAPEQVRELQRLALLHCVQDMPEETVKKAFRAGCLEKANEAFCGCAYRELRARATPRDIATRGGEDREGFMAKRAEAGRACEGDLEAETVKQKFLGQCRDEGVSGARCSCTWDVFSTQTTVVDVVLGQVDMDKLGPVLQQRCTP